MPAHLRSLARCAQPGCGRSATKELRNTRNATLGYYCDRHAKAALRRWLTANPEEAPRQNSA